jgi:hypothetical protein
MLMSINGLRSISNRIIKVLRSIIYRHFSYIVELFELQSQRKDTSDTQANKPQEVNLGSINVEDKEKPKAENSKALVVKNFNLNREVGVYYCDIKKAVLLYSENLIEKSLINIPFYSGTRKRLHKASSHLFKRVRGTPEGVIAIKQKRNPGNKALTWKEEKKPNLFQNINLLRMRTKEQSKWIMTPKGFSLKQSEIYSVLFTEIFSILLGKDFVAKLRVVKEDKTSILFIASKKPQMLKNATAINIKAIIQSRFNTDEAEAQQIKNGIICERANQYKANRYRAYYKKYLEAVEKTENFEDFIAVSYLLGNKNLLEGWEKGNLLGGWNQGWDLVTDRESRKYVILNEGSFDNFVSTRGYLYDMLYHGGHRKEILCSQRFITSCTKTIELFQKKKSTIEHIVNIRWAELQGFCSEDLKEGLEAMKDNLMKNLAQRADAIDQLTKHLKAELAFANNDINEFKVFIKDIYLEILEDTWIISMQNETAGFLGGAKGSDGPPAVSFKSVFDTLFPVPYDDEPILPYIEDSTKKILNFTTEDEAKSRIREFRKVYQDEMKSRRLKESNRTQEATSTVVGADSLPISSVRVIRDVSLQEVSIGF